MISKVDRIAYIATPETITIVLDGQHRVVQVRSKSHRNEVVRALEIFKKSPQTNFDKEQLEVYLAPIRRAVLASDNRFELSPDGKVLYLVGSNVPIPNQLGKHIIDFLENSLPVEALVNFWESCLRNPHYIAIEELFNFLEENRMPITDDGGFLGYKKLLLVSGKGRIDVPDEFGELKINETGQVVSVTGGFVLPRLATAYKAFMEKEGSPLMVDVYSQKIEQRVGDVVKIDRLLLNELDRRQECGYGLHIGAFSYSFNGNVRVLCKVMPEDVIACNEGQAKLRTCSYQIVSFVDEAKEIKDLYVNLNKQETDIANGCNDDDDDFVNEFDEGDDVKFIGGADDYWDQEAGDSAFNTEDSYRVLQARRGDILIVNDFGEAEWAPESDFAFVD